MLRMRSLLQASALLLVTVSALFVATTREGAARPEPRNHTELGLPSPDALGDALLQEFQQVYSARNVEAYRAMFDRWVFSYEFSPLDHAWDAPDAWNFAEEVRTAEKMFTDENTTLVDLRLVSLGVSEASVADKIRGEVSGVWKVTALVYLSVDRESGARGHVEHRLHGQMHEFYFRRGTEDEGRAWKIVYWRDLTGTPRGYAAWRAD